MRLTRKLRSQVEQCGSLERLPELQLGLDRKRVAKQSTRFLPLSVDSGSVRVAVIGAGKITPGHLQVLHFLDNVELVGIANRGGPGIQKLAAQFNIPATFSNWKQMVEQTRPDALFVLVSAPAMATVASECLEYGIPCFFEKPVGMGPEETARVARIAEERNVLHMIGVNRRYLSVVDEALRIIRAHGPLMGIALDAPEPIAHLLARTDRSQPKEMLDRWIYVNTIHVLDLLRYAGGDVSATHTFQRSWQYAPADSYAVAVEFTSGTLGTINAHWQAPGSWGLTLHGQDVRVELADNLSKATVLRTRKLPEQLQNDPVDLFFRPGFFMQDRSFLQAVANQQRPPAPASDVPDHLKTMQFIDQIAAS